MGVKDGFCFWPGMWRGPEELARTIVPGMKGKEGKRGGGDDWEKETKKTPGEPQLGDIFLSPRDRQAKSGCTGSLKLKKNEAIPQSGQK